jgi:ubiquinone/menaquinone biosynthesis C-methylase UbiE
MYEIFETLSDEAWLELLKRSIAEQTIEGVQFPGFPDEATQVLFTSTKWEAALDEAYLFYKIVKNASQAFAKPLGRDTRYLDFGIGWARITRMFLKDVSPANICGVDVTPEILSVCKALMPVGEYKLCQPRGRLDYDDESFDLVTAYSVFSHLSPENGTHWLRELKRVVRRGGLIVLTTLPSSFVALCLDVANNPESSDWAKMLAKSVTNSYPDWKCRLPQFPKDELLYLPSGGGFDSMGADDYGWAMVQESYARKEWTEWFEIVEFRDDPRALAQAYMTLRRK